MGELGWAEWSAEKRLEALRAEVRRMGVVTAALGARVDALTRLVECSMRAHGVGADGVGGEMREILRRPVTVADPLA